MLNDAVLMDAMYNATTACTHGNPEKQNYAKGVMVGVVSGIMAQGATFGQAIATLADVRKRACWFPGEREIDVECIPDCWRNEFRAYGIL